jgi:hypothetical protein
VRLPTNAGKVPATAPRDQNQNCAKQELLITAANC